MPSGGRDTGDRHRITTEATPPPAATGGDAGAASPPASPPCVPRRPCLRELHERCVEGRRPDHERALPAR
jgi:hypothetical protein